MDIRSYFRSASKSSVVSSSRDSEDGNEAEIDVQPHPPKKHCSSSTSEPPSKSGSGIRKYNKKWEETFTNWKKVTQKMKSQSKSEVHLLSCQSTWKLIELEKKDPLSASFKMLESSKGYKIGWRLKL